MRLTIILEVADQTDEDHRAYPIAEQIHHSLKGHTDYIDSNVVLSFVKGKNTDEVTLYFSGDDCDNREFIREKAKKAIDIFAEAMHEEKRDYE